MARVSPQGVKGVSKGLKEKEPAKSKCNARLKGRRGYCSKPGVESYQRCRLHSGGHNRGELNPRYKDGSRMRSYVPEGLRSRFDDLLSDTDYLALKDSLAMTRLRKTLILERLQGAGSEEAWRIAQSKADELHKAITRRDTGRFREVYDELQIIFEAGVGENAAWRELREVEDHERKLVSTELERIKAHQAAMSLDEVMALVHRLLLIIGKHVADPKKRTAIGQDIEALIT